MTHSQNPGARQDTAAVPGKPLTGALRDDFISSTCAGGFFKTTTKCPRFRREEEMDGGWVESERFFFSGDQMPKVVKLARSRDSDLGSY